MAAALLDVPTEIGVHVIAVRSGEMIPNPAMTNHMIYGPCRVEWTVHPDHGITARITEGNGSSDGAARGRQPPGQASRPDQGGTHEEA